LPQQRQHSRRRQELESAPSMPHLYGKVQSRWSGKLIQVMMKKK
jgi:hypothetical protein